MNDLTKQQGITIFSSLISVAVVVMFSILVVRFVPVYVQHYHVIGSAKSLRNLPTEVYMGPPNLVLMKLKKAMSQQLRVNNVDHISLDNIRFFPGFEGV